MVASDSTAFLVIGHRGAAGKAPENTAPSFETAVASGVPAVELDVQLTRDGRALVHHDPTTRRVCGFDGVIREMTLEKCRRLHVRSGFRHSKTWNRIRLISLDEAMSILRPDVEVHVELKGEPDHGVPLAREVAEVVSRTGGPDGVFITSSVPRLLEEIKSIAPEIPRGIVYPSRPGFDLEDLCRRIDPEIVVPNRAHIARTWVKQQQRAGRRVLPYTVNTRSELVRVHRLGVDGIVTDHPEQVASWLGGLPRSRGRSRKGSRTVRSASRKSRPLLAIDLGSSEVKVALVSPQGEPLRVLRRPLPTLRGPQGEIGLNAEALERAVSRTAIRLLRDAEEKVDSVTIASQRSTFVLWHRLSGKPVGDAPSWRCLRGRRICSARKEHADFVARKTGLRLAPSYSASKIAWKLRRSPCAPRDLLCGPLSTYLIWCWSRGTIFKTEPTLAARTLLMNLKARSWDPDLLDLFGVPMEILPEIGDTRGELGQISWGEQRLSVRCQVGDQQAALVAFCPQERKTPSEPCISLNLGTGGFLVAGTGAKLRRVEGLLSSVAWSREDRVEYLVEGTVHRVVPSIQGFAQQNGVDVLGLAEMIARAQNRAFLLPAEEGLGSPFWDPRKRTIRRGSRQPESQARALFESLAFLVRENLLRLNRLLPGLRSMTVGGGLSRNPHLLQILSDVLALPIQVSAIQESTLTGAALLAQDGDPHEGSGIKPVLPRVILPRTTRRRASQLHREWRKAVLEGA